MGGCKVAPTLRWRYQGENNTLWALELLIPEDNLDSILVHFINTILSKYCIYLETRAASKFWCWSSKTVFHLIAAEISGMRRSLGNKYGFRFWCWNAPFLPMIAPFLPVIAPSLPVQNFHCAVFVELRHVFYIAPFLWTCAWFFCRLGMRPKFWIHESLGIYR